MPNVIVGGATKREGNCSIRSSGGIAVLDETYYYLVRTDAVDEPYLSVLGTSGLPIVNQSVSPSGFGICRTKSAKRWKDNPLYWDVECEFSSEVEENQSGNDPSTDPTAWIPIYETRFERMRELVTADKDGDPVVNSNGRPFPNGLTVTRKIPIWQFYQFEAASLTDEQIIDRADTVNSVAFRGREPATLLLDVLQSSVGFYYGQRLRLTKYQLKYNEKNWKHKRLDVDTGSLISGVFTPNIVDGVLTQCGLDGNGTKVADGDPPAVLEFEMFDELDFNDFIRVPV